MALLNSVIKKMLKENDSVSSVIEKEYSEFSEEEIEAAKKNFLDLGSNTEIESNTNQEKYEKSDNVENNTLVLNKNRDENMFEYLRNKLSGIREAELVFFRMQEYIIKKRMENFSNEKKKIVKKKKSFWDDL